VEKEEQKNPKDVELIKDEDPIKEGKHNLILNPI
jgi:hypothetical protein